MEPVTHILTGACLARSGLNRRAAYATLTMAVAAELPDIDTLWGLRGPVEDFTHHRGITHTFLGLPFEALLLTAAVFGVHRWRERRAHAAASRGSSAHSRKPLTRAPVRWGLLYGFALLALLSHLLLDYTNNYGIRPLFPFDDRWHAASLVFIFDPLIFVFLLAGLVAPALFGMVSTEIGVRKQAFRAPGWALAALVCVGMLWGFRAVQHAKALNLGLQQSVPAPVAATPEQVPGANSDIPAAPSPVTYLQPLRVLASPDPLDPFAWSLALDFGPFCRLAEANTRDGTVQMEDAVQPKPARTAAILAAVASPLGRAYLDWSTMPFIDAARADGEPDGVAALGISDTPEPPTGDLAVSGVTVVTFRDPRFLGGSSWLHRGDQAPLTATVTINANGRVLQEVLDGRAERLRAGSNGKVAPVSASQ